MKFNNKIIYVSIGFLFILIGCLRKMEFNKINDEQTNFRNNVYTDSHGKEWGIFINNGYYTINPYYWYLLPLYLKIELAKNYNEYEEFGPGKIYDMYLYKKENGNWQKWVLLDSFESELFERDPSFCKIFEHNDYI